MCVNGRAINKKYHFLVSRLNDLHDILHGACMYSKIDMKNGYHQVCMNPGDEQKTIF